MTIQGSCLCGHFRFHIDGPIHFLKNCHCTRCRKMSGSSFLTYARVMTKDLHVTRGKSAVTHYERAPGNVIAFCKHCGSLVPCPPAGSPQCEFGAGLLDDDPKVGIAYHIYVTSRAPWCEISDGLPQYDEQISKAE